MKKSSKGLVLTLLFAVLLNAVVFTPSVSAAENFPTVWVKIYRIQLIDDIENVLEEAAKRIGLSFQNIVTSSTKSTNSTPEFVDAKDWLQNSFGADKNP